MLDIASVNAGHKLGNGLGDTGRNWAILGDASTTWQVDIGHAGHEEKKSLTKCAEKTRDERKPREHAEPSVWGRLAWPPDEALANRVVYDIGTDTTVHAALSPFL